MTGERERKPGRGGTTDPLVVSAVELNPVLNRWIVEVDAEIGGSDSINSRTGGEKSQYAPKFPSNRGMTRQSGLAILATRAEVSQRQIWAIRNGERKFVTLAIADRLLTAIDQNQAFHDGRIKIVPNPMWTTERYQAWLAEEGRGCSEEGRV